MSVRCERCGEPQSFKSSGCTCEPYYYWLDGENQEEHEKCFFTTGLYLDGAAIALAMRLAGEDNDYIPDLMKEGVKAYIRKGDKINTYLLKAREGNLEYFYEDIE